MDKRIITEFELLSMLDQLLAKREGDWWDGFYADRAKPCPFFISSPDESLSQWLGEELIQPGRAIDFGCGNGRNSIFLAQNGFDVVGVDYSAKAIDWAHELAKAAEVQPTFLCKSVFELDFENESFDLVCDSGCFHHIPPHRRGQYCNLVSSSLKPGGWFCLTTFCPEGGSGLTDFEVYEQRSLKGGLGYSEKQLREIWSPFLFIEEIRPMRKQESKSGLFGEDFLIVMLARKP